MSIKKISAIVKKDLKIEYRTKHTVIFMFLFSFITLLMFNFSASPFSPSVKELAPAFLWFVLIFAGMLGVSRAFIKEKEAETLEALEIAPVRSEDIFLGKTAYNLILIFVIEIITFLIFIVLFNYAIAGSILHAFIVLTLGSVGFVVVSTLISAIAIYAKARELILQIVALPFLLPVIIPTIISLRRIMQQGESIFAIQEVRLIIGYVAIMLTLAYLLFDYVFEE